MAKRDTVKVKAFTGDPYPRGKKMKPGKAWRLTNPGGRTFKATLVKRLDIGKESVAIFRVVRSK
jgi:hypothetical protein